MILHRSAGQTQTVAGFEAAGNNPGLVNSEPYRGGWFFKLELSDPSELDSLLSPHEYHLQISA